MPPVNGITSYWRPLSIVLPAGSDHRLSATPLAMIDCRLRLLAMIGNDGLLDALDRPTGNLVPMGSECCINLNQ